MAPQPVSACRPSATLAVTLSAISLITCCFPLGIVAAMLGLKAFKQLQALTMGALKPIF